MHVLHLLFHAGRTLLSLAPPTQRTITTIGRVLACAGLVLFSARAASADSISWIYTGAVVDSYDDGVIPVGTSANFKVTVHDRTRDYLEELGAPVPDWAGAYWSTLTVWLPGRQYTLLSAVMEINYDPEFLVAWPGSVLLREFRWQGPALFGFPMGFVDCYDSGGGCMDPAGGGANPASDDVPAIIPSFEFSIRPVFGPDERGSVPLLTVRGSNPQRVPEPVTGVLIAAGVVALAVRRRWRQSPR
jgi:hypothetical protein